MKVGKASRLTARESHVQSDQFSQVSASKGEKRLIYFPTLWLESVLKPLHQRCLPNSAAVAKCMCEKTAVKFRMFRRFIKERQLHE